MSVFSQLKPNKKRGADQKIEADYQGVGLIWHKHTGKHKEHLDGIDHHDRLILVEAELEQTVMDVIFCCPEKIHPATYTLDQHRQNIGNR
jgi:hypothetical protein